MKILYIGSYRFPNYDAGAARVLNNAKLIREAGHEVSFISWGGEYSDADRGQDGKYRNNGFEYIITKELDIKGNFLKKLKGKIFCGSKTKKILFDEAEDIDAIITYNSSLIIWLLFFCKKRKIRLINDLNEWYSYSELKFIDWIPHYLNMHFIEKLVHNKIVISSNLDIYYKQTHNIILPPLCDGNDPKWNLQINDERIPYFNGITFIYAGTPNRKDKIDSIVRAINELALQGNAIRIIILGLKKEEYFRLYYKSNNSEPLHNNIIFLGRVSQDLVPAYYKKADFMILLREPTRKNMMGFPTKLAESIVSGVPVIINNTSDISKYIIDGANGFIVDGFSEKEIEETIVHKVLKTDKKDLESLKTGVKQIQNHFTYSFYKSEISTFLRNLQ